MIKVKKIAQLTGHNASIFSLIDGKKKSHFISGAGDGWIVDWNLDDPEMGKLIAKIDTQLFSMIYLRKTNGIVAGNMNGGVHWIDLSQPEHTKNIAHHRRGTFQIKQIGEYIFTIGGDGILTKWSIPERRSLESLQLSGQSLRALDYSHARNEIAIGASDNCIYLLDANTLQLRKTLHNAHDNSVFSIRYAPNGRFLLSGGRDAHLKIWELEKDFELISTQPAHWFTINSIVFHPKGHLFATGSRDKTIKIWDARTFKLIKVIETIRDGGHLNSVNKLLWTSYKNYLISGSDDRSMIIWDVEV